jgi:hypothetical protein
MTWVDLSAPPGAVTGSGRFTMTNDAAIESAAATMAIESLVRIDVSPHQAATIHAIGKRLWANLFG